MNATRRVVHLRLRAGLALATVGAALALSGCTATNPQQTTIPFDPADGRSGQIGGTDANTGILLRNFLVVSAGQGNPGRVIGAIDNRTQQDVQVQLAVVATVNGRQQQVQATTVPVKAGEFVQVGVPSIATSTPQSQTVGNEPATGLTVPFVVDAVPAPPGAFLELFARTASQGGTTVSLPILPPVDYYASLAPSASPTAQPSAATPTGPTSPSANPSGAGRQSANPSTSITTTPSSS